MRFHTSIKSLRILMYVLAFLCIIFGAGLLLGLLRGRPNPTHHFHRHGAPATGWLRIFTAVMGAVLVIVGVAVLMSLTHPFSEARLPWGRSA